MKYLAFTLGAAAGALVGVLFALDAGAQQQPAAPPAAPVVPVAPATLPPPAHRWTAQQVREAFEMADADNNGELSRAEIQRVPVMPRSFEEMDQNKDGVLTRAEFEAGFAR